MDEFFARFRLVQRHWWVVAAVLIIVLGATAFFTFRQPVVYRASTTLILGLDEKVADVREVVSGLRALQPRTIIATASKIPKSDLIEGRAREKLGIGENPAQFYYISSSVLPETNIFRIDVEAADPRLAAELANAVARETQYYIKKLYGIFELRVLDPAVQPKRPVRPRLLRNLGAGAAFGLFVGIGLAFLVAGLRETSYRPGRRGRHGDVRRRSFPVGDGDDERPGA